MLFVALWRVFVILLAGSPGPQPPRAQEPRRPGARLSSIEGRITLKERKLQRVAGQYAGSGSAAAREIKPLPMVVFLSGRDPDFASAARPEMSQRDTAFAPDLVVVPVGTTVRFPNRDPFFHNVFSYSKTKRFDLGRYPRGDEKTVTFDHPGAVNVLCEIHKWMRAGIVVVENRHHVIANADGTFTLPDVAPGAYKLTVWQFERGSRTVDVTVPASGSARVDVTL